MSPADTQMLRDKWDIPASAPAATASSPPNPSAALLRANVANSSGVGQADATTVSGLRIETAAGTGKGKMKVVVFHGTDVLHTDQFNPASSHSRRKFINAVSERKPGVDEDELERQLNVFAARAPSNDPRTEPVSESSLEPLLAAKDEKTDKLLAQMPAEAVHEAEELLLDPRLMDYVLADLGKVGIVGEEEYAATTYLIAVSRLLRRPLAAITQGMSSTGKSYIPERVATLLPPEAVLCATDITTNALYYMEPGSLMHTFVAAGERSRANEDDRAEATRALREMLSAGVLRKVVTFKDSNSSRMRSVVVWQPGPIAFIETTTKAVVFDEDSNRCLKLGTDESPEQTERIVRAQAEQAAGAEIDCSSIVARHQALHRMLRRCRVRVPFAPQIAKVLPTARQEARRAMPNILSVISAVALLHQRQRSGRDLEHGSTIAATLDDYVIARRLLSDPMGRSLGGALPSAVANLGRRLIALYGETVFTSSDVARDDGVLSSKGKINEYLRCLMDAGVTVCVDEGRGNKPASWKIVGDVPAAGSLWLPTIAQLKAGGA